MMNGLEKWVKLFVNDGYKDSKYQEEFIKLAINAIDREIGGKSKIYRIHTTDTSTEVRFYMERLGVPNIHIEGYLSFIYEKSKEFDCACLLFSDDSRILLQKHAKNGSFLLVKGLENDSNLLIQQTWQSDSYGEWLDANSPAWSDYSDPVRTFDRVDSSTWLDDSHFRVEV